MSVTVRDGYSEILLVDARRASPWQRGAAMPSHRAVWWARRQRERGGLDPRVLGGMHSLGISGIAGLDRTEQVRRVEAALAEGLLLAIEQPFLRALVPLVPDTEKPELGPPPPMLSWIEIELLDQAGKPVPNEPYRIVCADGRVRSGALDGRGRAREDEIDPGQCKVSFPRLCEWKAAG
jgi:hypothetical protein